METALNIACQTESVAGTNNKTASIKVYPNPATESIFVEAQGLNPGAGSISVTDLAGKQLIDRNLQSGGNINTSIDIRSLSPGIYLLNIKTGEQAKTMKFVKQ